MCKEWDPEELLERWQWKIKLMIPSANFPFGRVGGKKLREPIKIWAWIGSMSVEEIFHGIGSLLFESLARSLLASIWENGGWESPAEEIGTIFPFEFVINRHLVCIFLAHLLCNNYSNGFKRDSRRWIIFLSFLRLGVFFFIWSACRGAFFFCFSSLIASTTGDLLFEGKFINKNRDRERETWTWKTFKWKWKSRQIKDFYSHTKLWDVMGRDWKWKYRREKNFYFFYRGH